jgi:hypothetical protein
MEAQFTYLYEERKDKYGNEQNIYRMPSRYHDMGKNMRAAHKVLEKVNCSYLQTIFFFLILLQAR